ncbi:hypothetical protein PHYBOEH_005829 [Phytophthora boehmeriae]|uniref:BZIP domain-containing protein n=1 Tax=Phytophthora boehmeriae TaxID=109152 RepID=A0A8T1X550_9STRA|nr:hypothetical protein PHYBOEH_005829 [Phytophthora boehmeriae]
MHVVASLHPTPSPRTSYPPAPPVAATWSEDDQELLDILFMTEPPPSEPSLEDVKMEDAFSSPAPDNAVQVQQQVQPASPVAADSPPKGKTLPKGKLTAVERRARHREVVKRAYHRNKAALKSLRDTVKTLEDQLEKLSLSKQQQEQSGHLSGQVATGRPPSDIERRYALLTTQQEELGQEAARLRLLLNYRQQFAVNMVTLAQRAASISGSDDSDNSDTDSDTISSTSSWFTPSPSPSSTSTASTMNMGSPMSLHDNSTTLMTHHQQKSKKSPLYNDPHPTCLGPNVSNKAPLAVAMRKQIGYKPLAFEDSTTLVNETYRSILAFSLSGRALSTGANIMGWEDKRLLDGTSLKFSLRKRFPGQNALRLMASTWQCLSDPECSDTKFRGLMTLRVLQRVNDDTIVAMRDSQSEDGAKIYRCVYILFRVRTRKGFLICVQSIAPERLTDPALNCCSHEGKPVQWVEMSSWFVFEHADGGACSEEEGCAHVEYGGCMDNGDNESVALLAMNTLSIVLRWETTMVGPLFTLPLSS